MRLVHSRTNGRNIKKKLPTIAISPPARACTTCFSFVGFAFTPFFTTSDKRRTGKKKQTRERGRSNRTLPSCDQIYGKKKGKNIRWVDIPFVLTPDDTERGRPAFRAQSHKHMHILYIHIYHTCIHACIHTVTHTCMHYVHTYLRTDEVDTYIHACMRTYVHACKNERRIYRNTVS